MRAQRAIYSQKCNKLPPGPSSVFHFFAQKNLGATPILTSSLQIRLYFFHVFLPGFSQGCIFQRSTGARQFAWSPCEKTRENLGCHVFAMRVYFKCGRAAAHQFALARCCALAQSRGSSARASAQTPTWSGRLTCMYSIYIYSISVSYTHLTLPTILLV